MSLSDKIELIVEIIILRSIIFKKILSWFYLFKMVGEVHLSIAHMHGNAYLFSQFVKVSLSDKIKICP